MYGVVLWSDKKDRKAVIWCEDHGDLAFYRGRGESVFDGPTLDAGDLVQFQLKEGRDIRLASDPRLVAEQQYPGLADNLRAKGMPAPAQSGQANGQGNVIAFTPRAGQARLAS